MLSESDEERFWDKVDKRGADECWPWTAAQQPTGYGNFWNGERYEGAHRVAYKLEHGEINNELVRHICDNPECVNPNHLLDGSHSDNSHDAFDRGLRDNSGENHPRSKLTEREVIEIKRRFGEDTEHDLAEEFGVSRSTISHIRLGHNWGDV